MQNSFNPNDTAALAAWQGAFDAVFGRIATSGQFPSHERELAAAVHARAVFVLDAPYSVRLQRGIADRRYVFAGAPEAILRDADLLEVIAGHEVYHAMALEKHPARPQRADGIAGLVAATCAAAHIVTPSQHPVQLAYGCLTAAATLVALPVARADQRRQEHAADAFALKLNPGTDLDALAATWRAARHRARCARHPAAGFLLKLWHFAEAAGDIAFAPLATHPTPRQRRAHLVRVRAAGLAGVTGP